MNQTRNKKERKKWISIVTFFVGPLLSIIVSLSLKLATELSVVIVIFAVFMGLVVFVMNNRLEQASSEAKEMYEAYTEGLKHSYPLEVVIGHDAVERMFRILIYSTERGQVSV
jgi:hypothetical protein